MKKAAIIIGVLCLLIGVAQADIGVRASVNAPGGVYAAGSSWGVGPWPDAGALYQLVWSPVAPAITDITEAEFLAGKINEQILGEGTTAGFGQLAPQPIVAAVGALNDGYVFMRVYMDVAPALGGAFYQSLVATGPADFDPVGLPQYDAAVPGTEFIHDAAGGTARGTNGVIIPEPATLGLWGLGILTILVRRKMRS